MKNDLTLTQKEITSSVIQLSISIQNNNHAGLLIFLKEFIPLLKRFQSLIHAADEDDRSRFMNFSNEYSILFEYLFTDNQLLDKAKDILKTNENNSTIGLIFAIRNNRNPLPVPLKKSPEFNAFEDFVSKYHYDYIGDKYLAAKYALFYAINHKLKPETSFQKAPDGKVKAIKKAAAYHGMKGWKNFQTQYLFWEKICEEKVNPDPKYSIHAGLIPTIERTIILLKGSKAELEFANGLLNKAKQKR